LKEGSARTRLSDSLAAEVLLAAGGPLLELRHSQGLKGVGEKTIQKLEAIQCNDVSSACEDDR
jgi:hypothetical protein